MKNVKTLISLICLLAFANISFSQSAKMKAKAMEKVEKMNTEITSVNADAALTEEQKTQITALEVKRLEGIKEIKNAGGSEEDMKAKKKELNKSINQEINKKILTKDQRLARKEAKEEEKE